MIIAGDCNLGILLGDIVDVEGDTEEANDALLHMIGSVPHPMYRSNRSIHHLFQSPDPFLTATRFYDIEFRGHRHQSVLPPSKHASGEEYRWLRGTVFPVPPMPQELQSFYFRNKKQKCRHTSIKPKVLPHGLVKTSCNICGGSENIHRKRLRLEVQAFADFRLPWMCHKCRELDMRPSCRKIRKTLDQRAFSI